MMTNNPYQVVMPKLGLIMTEANLLEWHKAEGEWVEKGEPLFSFESDKSVVEIESPTAGTVHILVPLGTTVAVQTPVAMIYPRGHEMGAAEAPVVSQELRPTLASAPAHAPTVSSPAATIRATPKARRIARTRESISLQYKPADHGA